MLAEYIDTCLYFQLLVNVVLYNGENINWNSFLLYYPKGILNCLKNDEKSIFVLLFII